MNRPDQKLIGLTGGIATGKSTVLKLLADRGAHVIEADDVYHRLIAPSGTLVEPLVERFGEAVRTAEGGIDRAALGRIVFADSAALAELDRVTHPAVVAEVKAAIARTAERVIVISAIKLIESGLATGCDSVWVVTADEAVQVARLVERNGISEEGARRRIVAQEDGGKRLAAADVVIDNSGDLEQLEEQVAAAWQATLTS